MRVRAAERFPELQRLLISWSKVGWGSDELLREFVCDGVGEKESDAAFGVKIIELRECLVSGFGSRG